MEDKTANDKNKLELFSYYVSIENRCTRT